MSTQENPMVPRGRIRAPEGRENAVMMTPSSIVRQAPPLGDLGTKALVALLANWWRTCQRPPRLRARGAGLDDLRGEVVRRELVGAGVAR